MTIQITFTGETARDALEQLREFTAGLTPQVIVLPPAASTAPETQPDPAQTSAEKPKRTVKPKAETPKTDSEPEQTVVETKPALDEKALRDKIIQIFTPLMSDPVKSAKVTELLAEHGRVSKIPADQLEAFVAKAEELAKGA